jgi:ABC-type nitrate/sulfonate/bicarbonate transport system substrate-binding protein
VTWVAEDQSRSDTARVEQVLWYSRCPVPTATSMALSRGFLAREFGPDGIQVRSLHESSDPAVRLSHYTNDQVPMFREGGVVPPLWARARGASTTLLALAWIDQFQGLVALRDSGVESPAAIRGCRIALPRRIGQPIDFPRAIQSYGIRAALRSAGLDEGDVVFVDIETDEPFLASGDNPAACSLYTAWENTRAQTAEVLALVRREVDVIYTSGGHGMEIAALIDAVPVVDLSTGRLAGPKGERHIRVLTVSTELLHERRALVTRYIAALIRAADWAAANENDAWRIIAAEVGLSEDWAKSGYASGLPQRLRPEVDDGLLEALGKRASFLFERGFIDSLVDISGWLDRKPLQDAQLMINQSN